MSERRGPPSYRELRAAGLCTACRRVRTEYARCEECRPRLNARRGGHQVQQPRRAVAWNMCCQAAGFHRVGCVHWTKYERSPELEPSRQGDEESEAG